MKRVLEAVVVAALSAALTYCLMPAVGFAADTADRLIEGGIDVGRWARDLTALGGVVVGVVGMMLPLAVAVLKIWKAWATTQATRDALDATVAAVEGIRFDIDRIPGKVSEAPAANISARTRAWSIYAPAQAVAELRASIDRARASPTK